MFLIRKSQKTKPPLPLGKVSSGLRRYCIIDEFIEFIYTIYTHGYLIGHFQNSTIFLSTILKRANRLYQDFCSLYPITAKLWGCLRHENRSEAMGEQVLAVILFHHGIYLHGHFQNIF